MRAWRFDLPRLLAALFLTGGLAAVISFSMSMPPFQNPDELDHLLRAEQVSRFGLLAIRIGPPLRPWDSGGFDDQAMAEAAAVYAAVPLHPERASTAELAARTAAIRWGGRIGWSGFANTAVYPPFLYLPALPAIWVGKLCRAPVVETLRDARLLIGIAAVGVAALAIAGAGAGAGALWLTLLLSLPMSLSLMAAVSQDGLLIALAALASATLLAGMREDTPSGRRALLLLVPALAVIIAARPPYAPLAALPLFAGKSRIGARLGAALLTVVAAFAWILLAAHTTAIDAAAYHGSDVSAQAALLLHDPRRVLSVAAVTLWMFGTAYIREFIGVLGRLDLMLPGWFYRLAAVALAAGGVATAAALWRRPTWSGCCLLLVLAAAVAAVFTAQYLLWTRLGASSVDGVQGRYFLPIAMFLPPLLAAGQPPVSPRMPPRLPAAGLAALFLGSSAATALSGIAARYYPARSPSGPSAVVAPAAGTAK